MLLLHTAVVTRPEERGSAYLVVAWCLFLCSSEIHPYLLSRVKCEGSLAPVQEIGTLELHASRRSRATQKQQQSRRIFEFRRKNTEPVPCFMGTFSATVDKFLTGKKAGTKSSTHLRTGTTASEQSANKPGTYNTRPVERASGLSLCAVY